MRKLINHPYAQCYFDSDILSDYDSTFYSYITPIFSIRREFSDDMIVNTIQVINAPTFSITTAKQTTWALFECVYDFEHARAIREIMAKCERGYIISYINLFHCTRLYLNGELIKVWAHER